MNKLMRQWIQDGLITVDRRVITLRDLDGLRAIADQILE